MLNFPRKHCIGHLPYAGPVVDENVRRAVEFPWDRLNGKPLIYVSMGSLQNGFDEVFRNIAAACAQLPVWAAVLLGGGISPEDLDPVAGDAIVVEFAPQLELLQKASLTITHTGLNTTLESLSQGLPMVAIPVGNDQPGVASRIAYTGTGEVVPFRKASATRLRGRETGAYHPSYRATVRRLKDQINQTDGLIRASEVIETAFGFTPSTKPAS